MAVQIMHGHVLDRLRDLPEESVHCVITSVPYWGLRAYGTAPQTWPSGWKGEHGLEPSLGLWLLHQVEIWRAIRRVLRKDGVAWLNVGDCYAASANGRSAADTKVLGNDDRTFRDKPFSTVGPILSMLPDGYDRHGKHSTLEGTQPPNTPARIHAGGVLKPKDRIMLPARLVLALQDDGWWLRDEIVWHKPNPMPSSIKDRTTPAHEMVYLLARSARYFFDSFAIREPFAESSIARLTQPTVNDQAGGEKSDQYEVFGINARNGSRRPNEIVQGLSQRIKRKPAGCPTQQGAHTTIRHAAAKSSGNKERKFGDVVGPADSHLGRSVPWEGLDRNKRSVWNIPTESFPCAHFATFPTALVTPMILAGTSEKGCCAKCGAPWKRHIEADATTAEWSPSCACGAEPVPCTVLDPFGGSGTVGMVADRLGRDAVLIELNPDYAAMAQRRINEDCPLFTKVAAQ